MKVDNVFQAIQRLEQLNLSTGRAYNDAIEIFRSIEKLPAIIYTLPVSELVIFRSRPHDDDVLFTDVKDIINPPDELVKHFGRCNTPGQSKFYASENRQTSYMELVNYLAETKEPGEFFYATVGRWSIKSPVRALIVVSPNAASRTSEFEQQHGQNFDKILSEFDQDLQEAAKAFYAYIADRFQQAANINPNVHHITSAYCNLVLEHQGKGVDAIYYPSVPFQKQGLNFAFSKGFIEENDVQLIDVMRSKFEVLQKTNEPKGFIEVEQILSQPFDPKTSKIQW